MAEALPSSRAPTHDCKHTVLCSSCQALLLPDIPDDRPRSSIDLKEVGWPIRPHAILDMSFGWLERMDALVPSAATCAAEAGLTQKSALRARELVVNACQLGSLLLFLLSLQLRLQAVFVMYLSHEQSSTVPRRRWLLSFNNYSKFVVASFWPASSHGTKPRCTCTSKRRC